MTTKKSTTKKTTGEAVEKVSPVVENSTEQSSPAEQAPQSGDVDPSTDDNPGEESPITEDQVNESPSPIYETNNEAIKPIVLVVTKSEKLAEVASRSIAHFFEADVRAIVVNFDPEMNLVEKLADCISTYENETVILFDSIVAVNKFFLQDVGAIYAERSRIGWDYNAKTPVVLERSRIVDLLESIPDLSGKDFIQSYFETFHGDELPLVTDWRIDTFTLPVVSVNPSHKTLNDLLRFKRWVHVSEASVDAMLDFFSE